MQARGKRLRRRTAPALALALLVALTALGATTSASAARSRSPSWAPVTTATVRPGTQTHTNGGQCTANFVFFDARGAVYLGQAAHCSGLGNQDDVDGCTTPSLPLGTRVRVQGARELGTLAYSSWIAMQRAGERDARVCASNDFALVRLHASDASLVNPTIPFWGGPHGIATDTELGQDVFSYGNSSLRFGISTLSPKRGTVVGRSRGGWTHQVYTLTPGIPGDSGSAFLDHRGRALGTLSVLEIYPRVGSNGVTDLSRALAYMRAHSNLRVSVASGTEPFSPLGLAGGA